MAINKALFSSKSSGWETPQRLFDKLNQEFNFGLDAASNKENAKCPIYFSLDDKMDGLKLHWHSMTGTVWLNPPYGNPEFPCKKKCSKKTCAKRGYHNDAYVPGIIDWVRKAWGESKKQIVVCLLPVRSDTAWWDIFWDRENDKAKEGCKIRFIRGRLLFSNAKNSAPFPSAVVIFDRRHLIDNN
jgi:phage N-6-adenine-methyltransferase